MTPRTVILAPEARDDLRWIYDCVAEAAGSVTAARYIDRLETYCNGLELGSERGTRHDERRHGLRVVGFERRVSIAFTVDEAEVTILRLFYGADWEREL